MGKLVFFSKEYDMDMDDLSHINCVSADERSIQMEDCAIDRLQRVFHGVRFSNCIDRPSLVRFRTLA